jgi:hypothetical protein
MIARMVDACWGIWSECKCHRTRRHAVAAIPGDGNLARRLFASALLFVPCWHRHIAMLSRIHNRRRWFAVVSSAHVIAQLEIELEHERRQDQSGYAAKHQVQCNRASRKLHLTFARVVR